MRVTLAAIIAVATFYGIGLIGPLPVLRLQAAVPLYTDATLRTYQTDVTKAQADGQAPPPLADYATPGQTLWRGIDHRNMAKVVGVAIFAALVSTFTLARAIEVSALAFTTAITDMATAVWRFIPRRPHPTRRELP